MKERPIIFSGPMVRAILDGTKTQTRRVVKPQPERSCDGVLMWGASKKGMRFGVQGMDIPPGVFARCPYGKPGDRLWVREKFATHFIFDDLPPGHIAIKNHSDAFFYADGTITNPGCEDHKRGKWRLPIHMPRWASRITLEITNIRVERLQNISANDVTCEGVKTVGESGINFFSGRPLCGYQVGEWFSNLPGAHTEAFCKFWESINGFGSWEKNPWVWVVEFRRVEPC